ncbi:MAG: hypothetical protein ACREDK_00045 [Thermoplasmata archaeon]
MPSAIPPTGPTERPVDVYLFPAVLGGGLGDIEEVLTVGRRLAVDGQSLFLFRARGRPLPRDVDGPWDWPRIVRVDRPARSSPWAVTVSPSWGVTSAPERRGPLGRAGTWATESGLVESAYGRDRTLHLSLEEFARTLTSRQQTFERYREGGVATRVVRRRLARGELDAEVARFHHDYVRFRGYGVSNVLHLHASFLPSRAFAREFPNAVQVGPIVYPRAVRAAGPARPPSPTRPGAWVARVSASSASRLLAAIAAALDRDAPRTRLVVRGGGPPPTGANGHPRWETIGRSPPAMWRRRFVRAEVRIVTGSRTLLEALDLGGPFLYFNGAMGTGRRTRRHRPEKLDRLLAAWARLRVDRALRRDLSDVARLRRVSEVVHRAVGDPGWARSFPRGIPSLGYPPPFDRGEELLAEVVRALPRLGRSTVLVGRVRHRPPGSVTGLCEGASGRRSKV